MAARAGRQWSPESAIRWQTRTGRDIQSSAAVSGPGIISYSSRGGENWTKTDVKLACKTVFVQFSTSGGRPMLLVRHSRTRRCPP